MSARRILLLLAVTALLVAVPAARADGDPASDYLLTMQTFVPPDAAVPPADKRQLTSLLTRTRTGGYTLRVVLIASRYDLGAVAVLYRRPREYAQFLSQELRFIYHERILVVMPNGYGIAREGKSDSGEQKVLDRLPPPAAGRGPEFAGAATRAVHALAAQAARPLSGSTVTRDRTVLGAIVGAALAGLVLVLVGRRRRAY